MPPLYLDFYNLEQLPFSLSPNTDFFLAFGHYRKAFETLDIALQTGEGFLKITGEIGTGKTLLCRKLLNTLAKSHHTIYIPNPALSPIALLQSVATELSLACDNESNPHQLIKVITAELIQRRQQERAKSAILCIDEAQSMAIETLETMRLLTNIETESFKLLQVVLFGQQELNDKLNLPQLRQLKQRITFSYHLEPLTLQELMTYISHRLRLAGANSSPQFEYHALKLLHQGSGGYPRLINILTHKALLLGYGEGLKTIKPRHIKAAIRDTEGAFAIRFNLINWLLYGS
ncbi:DUF2075 domain-containing protein [Ectothiorhodospiraceae bacterium BW-2]|nr:DUF2075 domain-containing protein [Ectothiorhodospiraceae bacterium BW-2]